MVYKNGNDNSLRIVRSKKTTQRIGMGLDIYFYRVLDRKEEDDDKSSIDLLEGETNKATLAVFDAFKEYVYEVDNEYHDVWGI